MGMWQAEQVWWLLPAALLVALSVWAGIRHRKSKAAAAALSCHLSAFEVAIVGAAADTFFPADGPIPISGRQAHAVRYYDDYLGRAASTERFMLRLLLYFVELSPLLYGPHRRRFSRLPPAQRQAQLVAALESKRYLSRVSCLSLRVLLTMAYVADPRVRARMSIVAQADPFGLAPSNEPPAPAVSGTRLKAGADAQELVG